MAKAISVESMTVTGSVPAVVYGSTDTKSGPVRAWVSTIGAGPDVLLVTLSWTSTFGTARIASSTCVSARLSSIGGHGTRNAAVPSAVTSPSRVASRTTGPVGGGGNATVCAAPGTATETSTAVTARTPPSSSRSARAALPGPGPAIGPKRA